MLFNEILTGRNEGYPQKHLLINTSIFHIKSCCPPMSSFRALKYSTKQRAKYASPTYLSFVVWEEECSRQHISLLVMFKDSINILVLPVLFVQNAEYVYLTTFETLSSPLFWAGKCLPVLEVVLKIEKSKCVHCHFRRSCWSLATSSNMFDLILCHHFSLECNTYILGNV